MLYLNGTNVATTNLFTAGGPFMPFVPEDGRRRAAGPGHEPLHEQLFTAARWMK